MSAFLEEIKKTTENNKYKLTELIIKDLIIGIQKMAEEGRNQIGMPFCSEEQRKAIENFCKTHGFSYCFNSYTHGVITITW